MRRSPRSKAENTRIGHLSQSSGATFESWIEAQHVMAVLMGILGHVEHNQAQAKVINKRVVYTGRGCCDYTLLCPEGRYAAVEAKSTSDNVLLKSLIKPKQIAHLEATVRAGGLALLLVEFRHEDGRRTRYAVPWKKIEWTTRRKTPSVSELSLEPWKIDGCYLARFVKGVIPLHTQQHGRVFPRE